MRSKDYFKIMSKIVNVSELSRYGPYSHAVVSGNTVYLSGQVGIETGKATKFDQQFENAMDKIKTVLEKSEFSLGDVVKVSVYLSNSDDFQKMNELYSNYFSTNYPVRTTVVVSFTSKDVLVEIDVIASK